MSHETLTDKATAKLKEAGKLTSEFAQALCDLMLDSPDKNEMLKHIDLAYYYAQKGIVSLVAIEMQQAKAAELQKYAEEQKKLAESAALPEAPKAEEPKAEEAVPAAEPAPAEVAPLPEAHTEQPA